jgi:UDP-N-acetylglucosamine--N-acetylmuramyl-(pentapeptide) pyrophosphoryl-undecaprenol N-acetylglucosamine transferase
MDRIHIGICGIGLGHASRSLVIAERLLSMGFELSLSTYGDAVDFFNSHGFPINKVPSLSYGLGADGAFSFRGTILKNVFLPVRVAAQVLLELRIMDEARPAVAFSDTRASTVLAAKLMGIPVALLLNQFCVLVRSERWRRLAEIAEAASSIVGHVWSLSDRVLIADYKPPLTVSEDNLRLPAGLEGKTVYVGPVMSKTPRDYPPRSRLKEMLGYDPDEPLILIQATGPRPERERLVERITEVLPGLGDLQVIFTRGRPNGEYSVRSGRHWVVDWVRDEYELLAASDVVVSRAGQSLLTKALAFGCRLVVVPIPRHSEQESNARSLSDKGAAVVLGEDKLSDETMRAAIDEALDSLAGTVFSRYAEEAERLGGADEVVRQLFSLYKYFS